MLYIYLITFLINITTCLSHDIRKFGFVDGDIIIGALFPIHEQPLLSINSVPECGDIRDEYGMQRVEVLLKTINEINNDPKILKGIKLGVEIRDTCWDIPIALEQCLDVIKNIVEQRKSYNNQIMMINNDTFDHIDRKKKAITALIGPASSDITIDVQNLMQLFKIPQIGYSATTVDLSRKEAYKYFLRVVPSDLLQVKALIDIIRHFKWNYISLINSVDVYGSKGVKELIDQINLIDSVCISNQMEIDDKDRSGKFENVANIIFSDSNAKVIICFCQGETVKKLLKSMIAMNKTREGYLIIGTDGWADRTDLLGNLIDSVRKKREFTKAAIGAITLRLHSKPVPNFDKYFLSKNYHGSDGNPWFQEFWEHKFKCKFQSDITNKYQKICSGNESLFDLNDYVQDSKLGFVVKSVMTVAMGLHALIKKNKPFPQNKRSGFININGTLLMNEMLNLTFMGYDNETIKFDKNGDPPGRYEIMNYQYAYDSTVGHEIYKYQKIGSWKNDKLIIDGNIQWPVTKDGSNIPIKSICSSPCKANQFREFNQNNRCCWTCRNCLKSQFINRSILFNEKCVNCPRGFIPTNNKSACKEIPPSFMHWGDVASIIAIVFSCIGIIATVTITIILARFNDTPVVKSSTRELMYIILFGIALSYLTTFSLIYKPTVFSCLLTRIMPGLAFSMIFGSLVTKTNRIFRILAISKKKIMYRKGRFLTTTAQVIIVILLNVVEVIIISIMIWQQPPNPVKQYLTWDKTYLVCNTNPNSLFISMGFDAVLICFCTWYAFKTRNLPANFNEAKFIGFTMYSTCIVWIGLVVIYLSTNLQVISLCFAINLTASICIVLLFVPKIYIIILKPEKNERSAFTTTTEIQCHIGSNVNNQNMKKKSNKPPKIKYPADSTMCSITNLNNVDEDFLSLKSSFHNQSLIDGLAKLIVEKESKITQTEFVLVKDFMINFFSHFEEKELSNFEYLEENWCKNEITHLTKDSNSALTFNPSKYADEE